MVHAYHDKPLRGFKKIIAEVELKPARQWKSDVSDMFFKVCIKLEWAFRTFHAKFCFKTKFYCSFAKPKNYIQRLITESYLV